jgi:hypothetical protein
LSETHVSEFGDGPGYGKNLPVILLWLWLILCVGLYTSQFGREAASVLQIFGIDSPLS